MTMAFANLGIQKSLKQIDEHKECVPESIYDYEAECEEPVPASECNLEIKIHKRPALVLIDCDSPMLNVKGRRSGCSTRSKGSMSKSPRNKSISINNKDFANTARHSTLFRNRTNSIQKSQRDSQIVRTVRDFSKTGGTSTGHEIHSLFDFHHRD